MGMPKDWWPDEIIVRGRVERGGKTLELAFLVSGDECSGAHVSVVQENINSLREALWEGLHGEEELAAMKRGIERDRAMIRAANIRVAKV